MGDARLLDMMVGVLTVPFSNGHVGNIDLDRTKVNPNGGAIGLGHPLGATGAILMTGLLYELRRNNGRYGLVAMCIGGGQGIAAIFVSDGVSLRRYGRQGF